MFYVCNSASRKPLNEPRNHRLCGSRIYALNIRRAKVSRTSVFRHMPNRCESLMQTGLFPRPLERANGREKQLHHSAKEGEPCSCFRSGLLWLDPFRILYGVACRARSIDDIAAEERGRMDGWMDGRSWILRSRRRSLFELTDRSVVGVQVLGSHKLRHQRALADSGSAQHEDAIGRRALGRTALPRTRQRTRRRVPRRSRIRGGQVFRAASNRRKARRVLRLAQCTSIPRRFVSGRWSRIFYFRKVPKSLLPRFPKVRKQCYAHRLDRQRFCT